MTSIGIIGILKYVKKGLYMYSTQYSLNLREGVNRIKRKISVFSRFFTRGEKYQPFQTIFLF